MREIPRKQADLSKQVADLSEQVKTNHMVLDWIFQRANQILSLAQGLSG
jgi:hypothetical protein